MTLQEKLRMVRQLERLGVDIIEAGFPIASKGDFEAVKAIVGEIGGPVIAALARCKQEDIACAFAAGGHAARFRLHCFLATSDIHLQSKLKISREQALAQARESVAFAKTHCPAVEFSPEDATRSDINFLWHVVQTVIEA